MRDSKNLNSQLEIELARRQGIELSIRFTSANMLNLSLKIKEDQKQLEQFPNKKSKQTLSSRNEKSLTERIKDNQRKLIEEKESYEQNMLLKKEFVFLENQREKFNEANTNADLKELFSLQTIYPDEYKNEVESKKEFYKELKQKLKLKFETKNFSEMLPNEQKTFLEENIGSEILGRLFPQINNQERFDIFIEEFKKPNNIENLLNSSVNILAREKTERKFDLKEIFQEDLKLKLKEILGKNDFNNLDINQKKKFLEEHIEQEILTTVFGKKEWEQNFEDLIKQFTNFEQNTDKPLTTATQVDNHEQITSVSTDLNNSPLPQDTDMSETMNISNNELKEKEDEPEKTELQRPKLNFSEKELKDFDKIFQSIFKSAKLKYLLILCEDYPSEYSNAIKLEKNFEGDLKTNLEKLFKDFDQIEGSEDKKLFLSSNIGDEILEKLFPPASGKTSADIFIERFQDPKKKESRSDNVLKTIIEKFKEISSKFLGIKHVAENHSRDKVISSLVESAEKITSSNTFMKENSEKQLGR